MYTCTRCKISKPLELFIKNKSKKRGIDWCKSCKSEDRRVSLEKDPQRANIYNREYRAKNLEKCLKNEREYYHNNKHKPKTENRKEYLKNWYIDHRKNNLQYRISCVLRKRLYHALKGNSKGKKTLQYLGCEVKELIQHIESKWYGNMDWGNYGKYWEIDHIFPLSKLDLSKEENIYKGCNYKNLQPLTVKDNRTKSNKIIIKGE